jgi:hypothetical protein
VPPRRVLWRGTLLPPTAPHPVRARRRRSLGAPPQREARETRQIEPRPRACAEGTRPGFPVRPPARGAAGRAETTLRTIHPVARATAALRNSGGAGGGGRAGVRGGARAPKQWVEQGAAGQGGGVLTARVADAARGAARRRREGRHWCHQRAGAPAQPLLALEVQP